MASASPDSMGHTIDARSGNHPRLDLDELLYPRRLPAFEGVKHFITYDRSSVHKAPEAPPASLHPGSAPTSTPARTSSRTGSPPFNARQRLRAQKRSDATYADLPPLQQVEEDDEDYEDSKTLARYSAETNRWLLFAGIFALIITLFIVNFSNLPHQMNARRRAQEIVVQLAQITERLESVPASDDTASSLSAMLSSLNLTRPPLPTLAMEIRDEWAPTFWYTSLMVTLMGTILILTIKQWLMACTFTLWVLEDDDELPPMETEKRTAAQAERKELQRDQARMRKRKEEVRKTRKEALRKTEKVRYIVPLAMYSALGLFVCGVAAKLGSMVWIGY